MSRECLEEKLSGVNNACAGVYWIFLAVVAALPLSIQRQSIAYLQTIRKTPASRGNPPIPGGLARIGKKGKGGSAVDPAPQT